MGSLSSRISRLTRSPQGRQFIDKAQRYVKSPEGRRRVEDLRGRFAKKR
jgi:hypothetical protein